MKRSRIIFIPKLEDSDKLNGMANQTVAWSFNVNKFIVLHMKDKSSRQGRGESREAIYRREVMKKQYS